MTIHFSQIRVPTVGGTSSLTCHRLKIDNAYLTLNQVTSVRCSFGSAVGTRRFARTMRSRNRSAVRYHIVALNAVYQFISLSDVVCLTPSERESQWIAQSVNTHMHLRAEAASASSQRTAVPLFMRGTRSTGMRTHCRADLRCSISTAQAGVSTDSSDSLRSIWNKQAVPLTFQFSKFCSACIKCQQNHACTTILDSSLRCASFRMTE